MARLSHPNVVEVYDAGSSNGDVYLAMQLVDGQTLSKWLGKAPRSWRQILRLFADAAAGIDAAHRAGLVHRDLKPSNILVGPEDRVWVSDFGLSADLQDASAKSGSIVGTPRYMAPEQRAGGHAFRSI